MSYLSDFLLPSYLMVWCLCTLLMVTLVYSFRVSWRSPCAALGVLAMGVATAVCLYWLTHGGQLPLAAQIFVVAVTLFLLCRAVSPKVWPGGPFDRTAPAPLEPR